MQMILDGEVDPRAVVLGINFQGANLVTPFGPLHELVVVRNLVIIITKDG
jgi:hypothetical protein